MFEVSSIMSFILTVVGGIAVGFGFAVGMTLGNRLMGKQ